jgi:hypothetical protein
MLERSGERENDFSPAVPDLDLAMSRRGLADEDGRGTRGAAARVDE